VAKSKGFGKPPKGKNSTSSDRPQRSLQPSQVAPAGAVSKMLASALGYFQSGRLAEAEQLYLQILQQHPEQPDALHWLGVIVFQGGKQNEGLANLQKSLAVNPNDANAHNSLGNMLLEQGDLQQSALHLRRAIALNPNHYIAHTNIGNLLRQQGDLSNALHHWQQSIALNPSYAPAHSSLGTFFKEQGELEQAVNYLRQAIALNPNDAQAHNNLGVVLQEEGQWEDAIACYQQSVSLRQRFGSTLPLDAAATYINLGNALQVSGRFDEAIVNLQIAITLKPDSASAHQIIGVALMEQGNLEQAVIYLQQAIALDPSDVGAHYSLAHVLLSMGDLRRGFAEYEWRLQATKDRTPALFPPALFPQPLWDGSPLEDRTILIHAEQGLGDTIQFIRYLSLVKQYGNRIIVACQPQLRRLLEGNIGVELIEQQVGSQSNLPEFQVHLPLMSLPYVLGTTLETIPARTPYLSVPKDINPQPRSLLGTHLKVGCVWASGDRGSDTQHSRIYGQKSCPLSLFAKFLANSEVSFYSLQVGRNAIDLAELSEEYSIEDLSLEIKDFADTAALVAQMDLVISVDTAVAHLAGALGKPVWTLLSYAADWRWLSERQDSPWYPTMRLFRQPQPGDWESVIDRVATTLKAVVNKELELTFELEPDSSKSRSPNAEFLQTNVSLQTTVLEQYSGSVDYHKNLGLALVEAGKTEDALTYFRQIIALEPNDALAHIHLGNVLREQGDLEAAISSLQTALNLNPEEYARAYAHNSLGTVQLDQGNLDEAAFHFRQSITLRPQNLLSHTNLGTVLRSQGKLEEAVQCFQTALSLNSSYAFTHYGLGLVLKQQGKWQEAAVCLCQAITLDPNQVDAHTELGEMLLAQGQLDQAIISLQAALTLNPVNASVQDRLGVALQAQSRLTEAVHYLREATRLNPNSSSSLNNLSIALAEQGNLEEAAACLQQAIALDFNNADIHYNLAHILLSMGDLHHGFSEYEWRCQTKNWAPTLFPLPLWNGSNLEGKTLLLHAEQGFGDTIQFIRYVDLIKDLGGRIVVACQASLKRLLATVYAIDQLVTLGEPLPEFQVHAPLMSLPYLLKTTLATIPNQVPYLAVPEVDYKPQLCSNADFKVGLVWASGDRRETLAAFNNYQQKSCSLTLLTRLLSTAGVSFYSLQVGQNAHDIAQLNEQYSLQDLNPQISDFADTAALIAQMDLVISIDTAVAHLAGALGKSVWVLLPFAPDWRWLRERDDSPWYPTMKLFRQQSPGDWAGVIEQVAEALEKQVDRVIDLLPEPDLAGLTVIPSQDISVQQTSIEMQQIGQHVESQFANQSIASSAPKKVLETLVDSYNKLGMTFTEQGEFEEAAVQFRQAIALLPTNAISYTHLGNVLREQGKLEEAFPNFQTALSLEPVDTYTLAYTHNSFGTALLDQDKLEEAHFHFSRAVALRPNNSTPHYNLGHTLLAMGNLPNGLAKFEWRWQMKGGPTSFPQPLWDGSNLAGQTILLHFEGGLGDTIQFVRYLPLVKASQGRIIFRCQSALKRLLKNVPDIEQLIVQEEALPEFQVHAPLMSLPYLLKTTLETIPAQVPYLIPPPNPHFDLKPLSDTDLKVGLVWASGYRPGESDLLEIYKRKSCTLSAFSRLLSIPNVSFYSLQVGHNATDIAELDEGHQLQDLSLEIKDFADTAALVNQMDLVISVDTAVAHLAGALGKPVWLLLHLAADWRWLRERNDSPWYPTMRLFRQSQLGNWEDVIDQVMQMLKNLSNA
jgi:tetratricopeptide (TPR) repeat protein